MPVSLFRVLYNGNAYGGGDKSVSSFTGGNIGIKANYTLKITVRLTAMEMVSRKSSLFLDLGRDPSPSVRNFGEDIQAMLLKSNARNC